jgi:hypothetical protein
MVKSWKDKAQERAKENIRLKKRNGELVSGRDLWKKKYQSGLLLPPKVRLWAHQKLRNRFKIPFGYRAFS